MAIQRETDSFSEADSYERATAFLSGWIEDSLFVSNTKTAYESCYHRPFLPSAPDLPSGTLRRRSTASYDDNINSLVNSLRASLMQHQNLNRQSHHGIIREPSPSCVRAVLHKKPSTKAKEGGGVGSIAPLPFSVSKSAEEPQSRRRSRTSSSRSPPLQYPLNRDHHQQSVDPPVVRSFAEAPSRRSTRGSRDVPCSSNRRSRSAGERRRSAEDIAAKSQSEDIMIMSSPYTRTRRHSIDCDRSFASSSNDNCTSVDQPNQVEESLLSRSMSSLYDRQLRTPSRRRVHWPDPSDDDRRYRHGGSNEKVDRDTMVMVVSLPWTDHLGNVGHYTGQVNALIQPHGSGALQYDNGLVVKGVWNNGNPLTNAFSPKSSPVASPVVEKEIMNIKGTDIAEAVKRKSKNETKSSSSKHSSYHPTRNSSSKSSSRTKEGNPSTSTAATPSSSTQPPSKSSLERLSELDFLPNFDLGDKLSSPKYQIIENDPTKALNLVNQLRIHDFAWILRSSREWTYSIVADFPVERGEEKSIRFVIDKLGNTKTLKMKHWAKCVRLVNHRSQGTLRDRKVDGVD
jgi:hypothetical protein